MHQLRELKSLAEDGVLVLRFPEARFNIEELVRFYTMVSKIYPKVIPEAKNPGYGGWTLLSDSGDYRDGWQQDKGYDAGGRHFKKLDAHDTQTALTELSQYPEAQNVLRSFLSLGLKPVRTRMAEIEDGGKLDWHIDPPDPVFNVRWRAHLVVVTNETARFKWRHTPTGEVREFSLPADGYLYLVRVDVEHCVESKAGVRVHIISDFEILNGETHLEVAPGQGSTK